MRSSLLIALLVSLMALTGCSSAPTPERAGPAATGASVVPRETLENGTVIDDIRPGIATDCAGPDRATRLKLATAPDPGESRHKLDVLARHCEAIGRDVAEIETTSLLEADLRPGRQSPSDVIAAFRAQPDEGIEHVIVNLPDAWRIEPLETFGREIIPAAA